MLVAALLVAVLVGGCAKVSIKPKTAAAPPAPAAASTPEEGGSSDAGAPRLSLSAIINRDLQNGHYAEGETALRRYLQDHPGDRAAQFFLRQLTEDPKKLLGEASTPHIVQRGESYSTLAAKYLGDPNLFLALARYNDSTNPSLILVGSTLKLPESSPTAAAAPPALPAATIAPAPAAAAAPTAPPSEPPVQHAQQLENQSLALYRQGHTDQAVAVFDQALTLNPQLKSADPNFAALRRIWVANTHQQAMVLYLDQHLDQAIALWNRILVVDPGYEPAVVYRTRALELKQRLQQY
ncbi:MAG TPA: LysM domain-containing protein [Dyella sp.]|uniref:LysM peptidoglycan-binding domain-containing protein n=1 Tax=Dyella sp. TaxID=1869338 RepID=UPI002C2A9721|nr:LysM domain-containing protein [Dyella sp.]HUB91356.1 LysM domain-containing protein [Dyella sp.]